MSLGFGRNHLLESLGPETKFLFITTGVSCSRRRRGSHTAVGIEGASHHVFLQMNSEPFLSTGLLIMNGWCVELCLEGSISLLYSLCISIIVCSNSLLQHSRFSCTVRPYESCKIFKGRPHRNAFSKLVHRQYKSFPPDRFCQVEIKKTTGFSNKHRTA